MAASSCVRKSRERRPAPPNAIRVFIACSRSIRSIRRPPFLGDALFMSSSVLRLLSTFVLGSTVSLVTVQSQEIPPRQIIVNIDNVAGSVDHFFDLSVGSDYPGTLIRDDSQAQLKLVADELGFRYLRFHG